VLFANSGSEATDTALKLIRYYWNLKGRPEKKIHSRARFPIMGDHGGGVAVRLTPMHPQWDLPFPGFASPAPYWYGAKAAGYGDIGEDEFGILAARETDKIIREIGPDASLPFRRSRYRAPAD
jgi:putrescine aminotransferase